MGLYVPKGMWRKMLNFSTNSLALVLSSTEYSEEDYIMDYEEFRAWASENRDRVEEPVIIEYVIICILIESYDKYTIFSQVF